MLGAGHLQTQEVTAPMYRKRINRPDWIAARAEASARRLAWREAAMTRLGREIADDECCCGCGRKTLPARQTTVQIGRVIGMPVAYAIGHNRRKSPVEYLEEDRGYSSPCWIWQRATDDLGYARARVSGENIRGHRLVYERHRGPVPSGKILDHLCRNPSCVNPDHLEPVTKAENSQRSPLLCKLNRDAVKRILASDATARELAAEYGVHMNTIKDVRRGLTWRL